MLPTNFTSHNLDAEEIGKNPKIALEKIKAITNLENKGLWDLDKIENHQDLMIKNFK
jgi:hypothetical protein